MAAVLKVREEKTGTKAVSPRALGFTTKASMKNVEVRLNRYFCLLYTEPFPFQCYLACAGASATCVPPAVGRHYFMLEPFGMVYVAR